MLKKQKWNWQWPTSHKDQFFDYQLDRFLFPRSIEEFRKIDITKPDTLYIPTWIFMVSTELVGLPVLFRETMWLHSTLVWGAVVHFSSGCPLYILQKCYFYVPILQIFTIQTLETFRRASSFHHVITAGGAEPLDSHAREYTWFVDISLYFFKIFTWDGFTVTTAYKH